MMIIIVILVIIEIKITTIVMMMRIKMIEENGIGRRGVYFKWRSSQKFVKLTVLNVKLKLHPRTKVRATKLQEMSAGHTTMGERLKSAVGLCYKMWLFLFGCCLIGFFSE